MLSALQALVEQFGCVNFLKLDTNQCNLESKITEMTSSPSHRRWSSIFFELLKNMPLLVMKLLHQRYDIYVILLVCFINPTIGKDEDEATWTATQTLDTIITVVDV